MNQRKNRVSESRPYRKFLRTVCVIFALSMIATPIRAKNYENVDSISSEYVAVYNVRNGIFVYSKAADERTAPGATAKMMTGILALEYFEGRLDTVVTVTAGALRGLEGSSVLGLKAGENIPVRDLLYALLVAGANDAANVLAIAVSGSIADFVSEMNAKAAELGAVDTFYLNATGLDNGTAYTTAADTAKIAAYAYDNPTFMQMCSSRSYTVAATNQNEAVTVYTKNMLLSTQSEYYCRDAKGMSSGYTDTAGYCIVSAMDKGAYPYICVSMGSVKNAAGKIGGYTDTENLLTWASGNFTELKFLDKSEIICEIPVRAGRGTDYVLVVPEESVYAFLDLDTDLSGIKLSPSLDYDSLKAPFEKGTSVGTILILLDGEPCGSTKLVTKSSVRKSAWLGFWDSIGDILKSKIFLFSVIILLLTFFIFTIGRYFFIYKKAKQKSGHKNDRNIK